MTLDTRFGSRKNIKNIALIFSATFLKSRRVNCGLHKGNVLNLGHPHDPILGHFTLNIRLGSRTNIKNIGLTFFHDLFKIEKHDVNYTYRGALGGVHLTHFTLDIRRGSRKNTRSRKKTVTYKIYTYIHILYRIDLSWMKPG